VTKSIVPLVDCLCDSKAVILSEILINFPRSLIVCPSNKDFLPVKSHHIMQMVSPSKIAYNDNFVAIGNHRVPKLNQARIVSLKVNKLIVVVLDVFGLIRVITWIRLNPRCSIAM